MLFAAIAGVSAVLAAFALWVFARARTPFDYMVIGALATTVALAVAFVLIVLRTARKSGPRF